MAKKPSFYEAVADDHHIGRRCSAQRLTRDENGEPNGVSPAFFELDINKNEKDLSCDWLEFFSENRPEQIAGVKDALSKRMGGGNGSRIVVCNVGALKEIGSRFRTGIQIKGKGRKNDPSYSGVFGLPMDNSNGDLIAALVDDAVLELLNADPWPTKKKA